MSFNAAWMQVKCRQCHREYQCTPTDDYWALPGEQITGPEAGLCFSCMLASHGMDAETTPVRVLDADMKDVDPRDETITER